MSIEVDHMSESYDEIKFVGEIPVRNLWLLMLYASDMYREIDCLIVVKSLVILMN